MTWLVINERLGVGLFLRVGLAVAQKNDCYLLLVITKYLKPYIYIMEYTRQHISMTHPLAPLTYPIIPSLLTYPTLFMYSPSLLIYPQTIDDSRPLCLLRHILVASML